MRWRDRVAGWISPDLRQRAESVSADSAIGWTPGSLFHASMGAEQAARVSAVFACVSVIAEAVGSIPLDFYRLDQNRDGEEYKNADILNYLPNPLQTGADFWLEMAFNAVLNGEAVAERVTQDGDLELWPLAPARLEKEVGERRIGYRYTELHSGQKREIQPLDVFRFGGLNVALETVVPWDVARGAINLAKVLELQGEKFFQNSARIPGFLSVDKALTDDAIARLKKQFSNFSGAVNAGKTPVFEQGMKYNEISASNQDSQYVEIREHQIREIAMHWHVPLYRLGIGGAGKTASEQQDQDFVKYTLRPWVRRIEQAIMRDLMSVEEKAVWRPKFNLEGLLRGDSKTRASNRVLDRTSGTISINEARAQENLPRIDEAWADDVREPLNSNRAAEGIMGGSPENEDHTDA